jgi:hypothetical protein
VSGATPAHVAAQFDCLEALKFLSRCGADMENKDKNGEVRGARAKRARRRCSSAAGADKRGGWRGHERFLLRQKRVESRAVGGRPPSPPLRPAGSHMRSVDPHMRRTCPLAHGLANPHMRRTCPLTPPAAGGVAHTLGRSAHAPHMPSCTRADQPAHAPHMPPQPPCQPNKTNPTTTKYRPPRTRRPATTRSPATRCSPPRSAST